MARKRRGQTFQFAELTRETVKVVHSVSFSHRRTVRTGQVATSTNAQRLPTPPTDVELPVPPVTEDPYDGDASWDDTDDDGEYDEDCSGGAKATKAQERRGPSRVS